ncbi:MAG: MarR family winged helix-turn-helix transcriptional regulator [Vagococcus sp.]
MPNNEEFIKLAEHFMKVNNQISHIQKKPISFPNHMKLNTGAVHLIEAIGTYPSFNTTMLAEHLGVTKGAISQQISNLEQKKLIQKLEINSNKKERYFLLTDKGKEIFNYHETIHKDLYTNVMNDLDELTHNDLLVIHTILNRLSISMLNYQKEWRS